LEAGVSLAEIVAVSEQPAGLVSLWRKFLGSFLSPVKVVIFGSWSRQVLKENSISFRFEDRISCPPQMHFFGKIKKSSRIFFSKKWFCGGQEFSQNQSNSSWLAAEVASLASKNDHLRGLAHNPVLSCPESCA
jgi:hypothetical protein